MLKLGGWFKPNPEREAASERVRDLVRAALRLGDDATISVNEIECGDPNCPGGVETVILVRERASVTKAFKLPGPVVDMTAEMVAAGVRG